MFRKRPTASITSTYDDFWNTDRYLHDQKGYNDIKIGMVNVTGGCREDVGTGAACSRVERGVLPGRHPQAADVGQGLAFQRPGAVSQYMGQLQVRGAVSRRLVFRLLLLLVVVLMLVLLMVFFGFVQ